MSRKGEIWIWVSPGLQAMTIRSEKYGIIDKLAHPEAAQSKEVYFLEVNTKLKLVQQVVEKPPDFYNFL